MTEDPQDAVRAGGDARYCVLVSSCDAYADCWQPFFTLFEKFWRPPTPAIYLNTETRAFAFPGLNIHCPRVQRDVGRTLSWSDRLRRCLERIPYEVILYLQEDYFFEDVVDVAMLESLVDLMTAERISHISLVPCGRPSVKSEYPNLNRIDRRAEYRLSAQAGLWRTSSLRSYLRRHETVWELEWYGTRRARRRRDAFFCVSPEYDQVHGREVVPYQGTGIEHGRWKREIVEQLFAKHGIEADYSTRGFYDPANEVRKRRPRPVRAVRRLRSIF